MLFPRIPKWAALLTFAFVAILSAIFLSFGEVNPVEAVTRIPIFRGPTLLEQDFREFCVPPEWRPVMSLELRKPRHPEGASRVIDWRNAESRIRSILAGSNGVRFGLVIKNLETGRLIEHNARARFASASLVKIPILITLYKDLADERIRPSEGPLFREALRIGGSGVLKNERAGVKVNLRDLCHLMLQHSDNTATNILADRVGQSHVTSVCREFGWTHTDMVRPVMALELRRRGIENWTTPKEMAQMLEKMYRGELVSRKASDEMLRLMLNPPIDDRIPRYLPRGIDIIHKTGLIHDNAHDVGIIYLPGNQTILISAFADSIGDDYRSAKIPIARIARILYEEATPPAAQQPGRRRN
jgi:beta-lactamase class A